MPFLKLDKDEIDALLNALEAYSIQPPVVPDLDVYYRAVRKLERAKEKAVRKKS